MPRDVLLRMTTVYLGYPFRFECDSVIALLFFRPCCTAVRFFSTASSFLLIIIARSFHVGLGSGETNEYPPVHHTQSSVMVFFLFFLGMPFTKSQRRGQAERDLFSRVVMGCRAAAVVPKSSGGEDESWRRKTTFVH